MEALHSALQILLVVSMGEEGRGGCTVASARAGKPPHPIPAEEAKGPHHHPLLLWPGVPALLRSQNQL